MGYCPFDPSQHTNFVMSPPLPQSNMTRNWSYPSPGSKGHFEGLCKPCAFLYEGCLNDSACDFCHLCPPGELKRRKRNKLAARRKLNSQPSESGRKGVGSKLNRLCRGWQASIVQTGMW